MEGVFAAVKRRAAVVLSFELLREFMHIRPSLQIVSVSVSASREEIKVILDGPELAEMRRRQEVIIVPLKDLMDYEL